MGAIRRELCSAAKTVREALEGLDDSRAWSPNGKCQLASKLLAKYLVDVMGIQQVEGIANGRRYVADRRGKLTIHQSHFWLEQSGYVIDITADQFKDCTQRIIVRKDRRWHNQFKGQTRLSQEVVLNLNDFLLDKYRQMMAVLNRGNTDG